MNPNMPIVASLPVERYECGLLRASDPRPSPTTDDNETGKDQSE